jgi:hypothetical protein
MIENGKIAFAANLPNQFVYLKIKEFSRGCAYSVQIEDLRPYGTRLSQHLIDTAKFLGELEYRLYGADIIPTMVPRMLVKKWIFDDFQSVVWEPISVRMTKSAAFKKDGELRRPTFVWVDDRIIIKVMRSLWSLPVHRGKPAPFGLKTHSWQALALGSYSLYKK